MQLLDITLYFLLILSCHYGSVSVAKKCYLPNCHSIPVGVLAYRFSLSYLKWFHIYEVPKVIDNLFGSCTLPLLLDMTTV